MKDTPVPRSKFFCSWPRRETTSTGFRRSPRRSSKKNPRSVCGNAWLGKYHVLRGDVQQAYEKLRIACAEGPDYSLIIPQTSENVTQLLSMVLLSQDSKTKGLDSAVLEIPTLRRKALTCCEQGDFTQAAMILERVRKLDPDDSTTIEYSRMAYLGLGKVKDAEVMYERRLKQYRQQLDEDPKNAELLLKFAEFLHSEYERHLSQYRKRKSNMDKIGETRLKFEEIKPPEIKQRDEAIDLLRRAVELAPSGAEYSYKLALFLIKADQLTKASPYAAKAVELEPDNQKYRELRDRYAAPSR
jgi:tetratricopeptide (TPR) repeat protein